MVVLVSKEHKRLSLKTDSDPSVLVFVTSFALDAPATELGGLLYCA
jgi:hypothetical protein